jgi:hypothetical protein
MLLAALFSVALAQEPAPAEPPAAPEVPSVKEKLAEMFGQPNNHSGIRTGGVTAGYGGESVTDSKTGLGSTVTMFNVSKMFWLWSFEPGMTLSRRSVKEVAFADGYTGNVAAYGIGQTWLEFPMLVRTKVPTPKFVPPKPYAVAGPYLAWRVGGERDGLRGVDYGYYAGGGTEIYWHGETVISLDTRVAIGKLDLDRDGGEVKTSTVLATAGFARVPTRKRAPEEPR